MDKNLQRRVKYQISLIIAGIFLYISAHAQTVNITGKVTSADDGQPIPGVSIRIKGTALGSISSIDGSYSIAAEPGKVLVFNFLGYSPQEITVKQAGAINVTLKSTSSNLDEVVVVGFAKRARKDLTGAISSISGSELRKTQPTTFDQALQGKVAGVVVQQVSGQPGGGVSIQIRGVSSISGSNSPLYVIDGIIIPPVG